MPAIPSATYLSLNPAASAAAAEATRKALAAKKAADLALKLKNAKKSTTGSLNPVGIDFNLPPIAQALPVMYTDQGLSVSNKKIDDGRRAAMWFFDVAGNSLPTKASGTTATAGSTFANVTTVDKSTAGNYAYGFQWLWNPESVGSTVSINPDVVPSPMDGTANLSGLFGGMESVTISARINRITDMAMIRGGATNLNASYTGSYPGAVKTAPDVSAKIAEIKAKGTMADLEYIYRMCNGYKDGNGVPNTNALGIVTADTAFLSPTPVVLRVGKGPLVYVGWLNSIVVAHTMFTWDMIPIDTRVDFSLQTFATTSLKS